jgi:hypothetical protein
MYSGENGFFYFLGMSIGISIYLWVKIGIGFPRNFFRRARLDVLGQILSYPPGPIAINPRLPRLLHLCAFTMRMATLLFADENTH